MTYAHTYSDLIGTVIKNCKPFISFFYPSIYINEGVFNLNFVIYAVISHL